MIQSIWSVTAWGVSATGLLALRHLGRAPENPNRILFSRIPPEGGTGGEILGVVSDLRFGN
jgi:hypothetical protein